MTLYLDTSSLIKLYIDEPGSAVVRQLVDDAAAVTTSVITYAETRAALARLRRERALTKVTYAAVTHDFDTQWATYVALDVTDFLSREAGALAERYQLRGYDSVQLASFAAVARRAGVGQMQFSSFDDRLTRAARALTRTLRPA